MCPTAAVNMRMIGLCPSSCGSSEDGEMELVRIPERASCILLQSQVALTTLITEKFGVCCSWIQLFASRMCVKSLEKMECAL